MNLRVIVHEAEEGGYWAEVPAIPGCASQGETIEELEANVIDAIKGCLSGQASAKRATAQVREEAVSTQRPEVSGLRSYSGGVQVV